MALGLYLAAPWGNCICSAQTLSYNPKGNPQEGSHEKRLWTKEETRVETEAGPCFHHLFFGTFQLFL